MYLLIGKVHSIGKKNINQLTFAKLSIQIGMAFTFYSEEIKFDDPNILATCKFVFRLSLFVKILILILNFSVLNFTILHHFAFYFTMLVLWLLV